jgi:hypothetical protein
MAKKSSSKSVGRPRNPPAGEWTQWLNLVPQDKREGVAKELEKHKVTDYEGLIAFSQAMMINLLRGTIAPEISREIKSWTQLIFTMVSTQQGDAGSPDKAIEQVLSALATVAKSAPKLQATYTVVEAVPIEPERILLKANEK